MSAEIVDLASRRTPACDDPASDAGRQYVAHLLMQAAEAIARGSDAEAIVPVRNVFMFLERYVNRDNTDRGDARRHLLGAAQHIVGDDIARAIGSARMALRTLEKLDADGITLEEDRRRLAIRERRMVAAEKAAATRARNKALAARTGGCD